MRSHLSEASSMLQKIEDDEDLTQHPDASTPNQDVIKSDESNHDHVSMTSAVPSDKTLASVGPTE